MTAMVIRIPAARSLWSDIYDILVQNIKCVGTSDYILFLESTVKALLYAEETKQLNIFYCTLMSISF